MRNKHFLLAALTGVMTTMFSLAALADSEFKMDGYTLKYITEGNTAAITDCILEDREDAEELEYSIVIPEKINGYKVIRIADRAFMRDGSMESVKIPDGVTAIGDYAFADCSELGSVKLPDSLTSIGASAFIACANMERLIIPNSVTSIGPHAFEDCAGIESVTIPDSITTISAAVFQECTELTNVIIPDSVTTIEENAFMGCIRLTSITIPNSVTSVGNKAFGFSISYGEVDETIYPNDELTVNVHADSAAEEYCKKNGINFKSTAHTFADWKTTKTATCTSEGLKSVTCEVCGFEKTETIPKIQPTIKVSAKNKTLKKKKSFILKISKLAKGDSVKSVKSNKKSVATVKKVKKNQYKITAKKKGTAMVKVVLKSGKTATCKVKVK